MNEENIQQKIQECYLSFDAFANIFEDCIREHIGRSLEETTELISINVINEAFEAWKLMSSTRYSALIDEQKRGEYRFSLEIERYPEEGLPDEISCKLKYHDFELEFGNCQECPIGYFCDGKRVQIGTNESWDASDDPVVVSFGSSDSDSSFKISCNSDKREITALTIFNQDVADENLAGARVICKLPYVDGAEQSLIECVEQIRQIKWEYDQGESDNSDE